MLMLSLACPSLLNDHFTAEFTQETFLSAHWQSPLPLLPRCLFELQSFVPIHHTTYKTESSAWEDNTSHCLFFQGPNSAGQEAELQLASLEVSGVCAAFIANPY